MPRPFPRRPVPRALAAALAAVGPILQGCGGGGDGTTAPPSVTAPPAATPPSTTPPPAPLAVRLPVDTARPGAPLRVVVAGAPALVDGTLGGVALRLARQDDSTLVALVPEVPAGSQPLRLTVDGRTGGATVTVRDALAVPSPTAALEAALDATLAAYASPTPSAGFTATEWNAARAAADSVVRLARQRLAGASAAEQLAAARLVLALPVRPATTAVESGPLAGPLASPASLAYFHTFATAASPVFTVGCARAVGSATLSVGAYLGGLGALVAGAFVPGVNLLVAPFGAAVAFRAAPTVRTDVAALPEACAVAEGINVQALGATVFESGQAVAADLVLRARAMSGSDARSGAAAGVTGMVEEIHAAARGLPSAFGALVPTLPVRLGALPALPATARALSASAVRVVEVTPATVTLGASAGSDGRARLTATTTATAETPFTATLAHADDPALRTTVSGTVRPAAAVRVTVSPATATITGLQRTQRLTATVSGATDTTVRWSSSDPLIADVSPSGEVTSRASGTVTIRATSVADPARSGSATITVVSGIAVTLSPANARIAIGRTGRFVHAVTGTDDVRVRWSSSNPAVASVTEAGDVTGVALGTTTIRITSVADPSASATASLLVTSDAIAVTVTPSSATMSIGESRTFGATVSGTTVQGVTWSSSNSAVAFVDQAGRVTARANGTATITARSNHDVSKFGTATVTVGASAPGTPSGVTRLTSGVVVTISGSEGSERLFVITVPPNAARLEVKSIGGVGDLDLFVSRAAPPTPSSYNCASEGSNNTELCSIANPTAEEWYVLVLGFEPFSGATLTATVTLDGGTTPTSPTSPPPAGAPTSDASCAAYWRPILVNNGPSWRLVRLFIEGEDHHAPRDYADRNYLRFPTDGSSRWTYSFFTGGVQVYNDGQPFGFRYDTTYLRGASCVLSYVNQLGQPGQIALIGYASGELRLGWADPQGNLLYDWYWARR